MAKGIILHQLQDWSKIDEKDGIWGKVDLLRPENNFGIHRYNNNLWTSGQVGIGRIFDKDRMPIQENGKEHILMITSRYGLNPWEMLETVLLDDEYDEYINELERDGKFLYRIFYDQSVIKLPKGSDVETEVLFALSYINACYSLCKKGLKKSLIYHEENFTSKLRGKIDVSKNIRHNTSHGRNDKFYCKYLDFTEDTIENRIIKAALIKCQKIIKQKFQDESSVKNKVFYCLNVLKRVKNQSIKNSDYSSVSVGGLYSYYKPVLQQARSILGLKFQSYLEGMQEDTRDYVYTIPYIINMETLFEYYARTKLKHALKTTEYRVEKYSKKYYLQKGVSATEEAERGTHLMPFCIPDIIVYKGDNPMLVIDAKYKPNERSDRSDSHQLLAYVLLTGVDRCGFVLPGKETQIKEMKTTGNSYLSLAPRLLRYYELILGNRSDNSELQKLLL